MKFWIVCAVALACSVALPAKSHHHRKPRQSSGPWDHYLLTLSWSPEYCHSHPTDDQCTGPKHFGFVVHGLWPEYPNGLSGPEACSQAQGLSDPSTMLDIMPTLRLIQHEWTTHGSCSGLSADAYFGLIRNLFSSIHIPSQFAAPSSTMLITGAQTRAAFEQSNPGLQDNPISGCPVPAPICKRSRSAIRRGAIRNRLLVLGGRIAAQVRSKCRRFDRPQSAGTTCFLVS